MKAAKISTWPNVLLPRIASIQKGKKPSTLSNDIDNALPYLEAAVLRNQRIPQYIPKTEAEGLVLVDETDTLILWDGANAGEIFPGQHGVVASTMARVRVISRDILPRFLQFYLVLNSSHFRETATGSTVPHVRGRVVQSLQIPVPSLTVQERVVQILQKADDIRRKRQEASSLGEFIMQATFIYMFGDPLENPKGFPVISLGDIITEGPQNGLYKPQEAYGNGVKIVRTRNYYAGALTSLEDFWRLECTPEEIEKYRLEAGDIIINRVNSVEYVGKCALVPELAEDIVFESNTMRFRVDTSMVLPEYVVAFLCTRSCRRQIEEIGARRRAVNMVSINQKDIKGLKLPLAPLEFQGKFVNTIRQYTTVGTNLISAQNDSEVLFEGLLSRAFTGALTAAWEVANAEWIKKQVELQERLPQLLLLAIIHEKATRSLEKAAQADVLVTALMKYAFLLQMEGNGRRRFYHFIPYHYGPFAKDLYADLERLQADGLVTIENDTEEDKIRITITDTAKAAKTLDYLPEELKEDIQTIIDSYGDLNHNALLQAVYEKYPSYAQRSRLRKVRKSNNQ